MLTLQEYYGGRELLRPAAPTAGSPSLEGRGLTPASSSRSTTSSTATAGGSFARVIGYVLIPFPLWKLLFPKDSLLDMGLRVRGFFSHLWIYGLCLAVVVPVDAARREPARLRHLLPVLQAELAQLVRLPRLGGDVLAAVPRARDVLPRLDARGAAPALGSAAIFAMAVPYCMIHYGKPYLEAHGAIVAGVVLGSLAMRTRSIYAGFLVHITVAFMMDFLALWRRGALPTTLLGAGLSSGRVRARARRRRPA